MGQMWEVPAPAGEVPVPDWMSEWERTCVGYVEDAEKEIGKISADWVVPFAESRDIVYWAHRRFGWSPRPGQIQMLRAVHVFPRIAYRIGRQFGKTECLALIGLYLAEMKRFLISGGSDTPRFRGARVLMASAKDDWADTLYERVRALIEMNDEMAGMVREGMERRNEKAEEVGIVRIRLSPYKRIILPTGGFIDFRGPGDKGEGPRSKTYDYKILDEADRMPKAYWIAEGPTSINAPAGLTILSSTPTGQRDHFYRACTDPKMGYKEFHFSGELNPNMTADKRSELIESLGPEEYDREIRANWGTIMAGVFPQEKIDEAIYEGGFLRLRAVSTEIADPVEFICKRLADWAAAERPVELLLGADPGSTTAHPCEILLGEPRGDDLDVVGIISLVGYQWPTVEDVFRGIEKTIRLRSITIDSTGVGAPVCENLQMRGQMRAQVLSFEFSKNIVVGDDMRKNSKVWATDVLVSMLMRGNLGLPDDEDLLYQFRNHTVDVSRGRPIYSKVDDHIVDAARSMIYGFFKDRLPSEKGRDEEAVASEVTVARVKDKGVKIASPQMGKMKVRALNVSD